MKGHINRVCDVPSSISEADHVSRTAQTDIPVRGAWRITMTIVIVVDRMSIRPTCVVTVLGDTSVIHYQAVVQECPTIWRLYDYVTDPEREAILRHRESKQSFAFGQGGEGYIASDEWCYNCGNTGHLGDVSPSTVLGAIAPIRATKSLTKVFIHHPHRTAKSSLAHTTRRPRHPPLASTTSSQGPSQTPP